ncbi:MAG: hypothetical protein U0835_23840 [Isosphaeraceae bacterium]
MLALVVLVEAFVVRPGDGFASFHGANWRETARQLRTQYDWASKAPGREPEVVLLGDSLVKFGVYPAVMEEATNRRATNLAVTTGPTPASYVLFRRILAAGGRPRAIVIDSVDGPLAEGPQSRARVYPWADMLTTAEAAEIAWTSRDVDFLVQVTLRGLLHSFHNRFEIRKGVLHAIRGEWDMRRTNILAAKRNWAFNRGAQVNLSNHLEVKAPEAPPGQGLPGTWTPHPVNVVYLERIFDLASENGVAVFWVLPPIHPHPTGWVRYFGNEARFTAFVKGIQARHPDVTVLDGRYSEYPNTAFSDLDHLGHTGATAFSASVATVVDAGLQPSGHRAKALWLKLPDYKATVSVRPLVPFIRSFNVVVAERNRRWGQMETSGPEIPRAVAGAPAAMTAAEKAPTRR